MIIGECFFVLASEIHITAKKQRGYAYPGLLKSKLYAIPLFAPYLALVIQKLALR